MDRFSIPLRQRARQNISVAMGLWAAGMAVTLFMFEARYGSRMELWAVAVGLTAAFGVYLGVRRRTGAAFVAPFVSWLFAWLPLLVAAMIHNGVAKGFVAGIFLVTIGWVGIGILEFVGIFVASSLVRALRRSSARHEPDVALFGPQGDRQK